MKNWVCFWALVSACCFAGVIVHTLTHQQGEDETLPPPPAASASSSSSCVNLEDVLVDVAGSAGLAGLLWLSVAQGTAAALAMLLPAGPRCRALAFVAHAAQVTSHFMWATLAGGLLFVSEPENYHLIVGIVVVIFACGVFDVLGFLTLLSREEAEAE